MIIFWILLSTLMGIVLGKFAAFMFHRRMIEIQHQRDFEEEMFKCTEQVLRGGPVGSEALSFLKFLTMNTRSFRMARRLCANILRKPPRIDTKTRESAARFINGLNDEIPEELLAPYICAIMNAAIATTYNVPFIGELAREELITSLKKDAKKQAKTFYPPIKQAVDPQLAHAA